MIELVEENLITNKNFLIDKKYDLFNIRSLIIDKENITKITHLTIICGGQKT